MFGQFREAPPTVFGAPPDIRHPEAGLRVEIIWQIDSQLARWTVRHPFRQNLAISGDGKSLGPPDLSVRTYEMSSTRQECLHPGGFPWVAT